MPSQMGLKEPDQATCGSSDACGHLLCPVGPMLLFPLLTVKAGFCKVLLPPHPQLGAPYLPVVSPSWGSLVSALPRTSRRPWRTLLLIASLTNPSSLAAAKIVSENASQRPRDLWQSEALSRGCSFSREFLGRTSSSCYLPGT